MCRCQDSNRRLSVGELAERARFYAKPKLSLETDLVRLSHFFTEHPVKWFLPDCSRYAKEEVCRATRVRIYPSP